MKTKIFVLCLLLGTSLAMQAEKTIKVACVGNSITQGAAIANMQRDSYPGLLGQMLGAAYEVRNYGFSGRTLLNKGDRPYMKEQLFQDALAFEPDIVTIKLGTNDTKPFNWVHHHEFMHDLEQMVNAFSQLDSKPQIWLCYPVPAFHYDWGINDTIIRDQVIPYIRRVAQKYDLNTIDLYTPFIGKGSLF
ncbi:MAG: GDSL-type esterase/lipase family protein, partial [Bacteroidales bacterium]|nr:GDSL-type esterase/lipase family protein [Bacteroidales bacterium]